MASLMRPESGLSCGFRSDEGRRCRHSALGGSLSRGPGSPRVSTGEMKVGRLDWGVWGGFSDLLGDISALSSYEDALAEAVYEELDYLVTQKEGLLGSPGKCLCLPSWDLWLLPPTGCVGLLSVFRPHACPRLTEAAPPKW